MCDSDDPGDNGPSGMDLTGFLFGNIDESGQLEDDGLLDDINKGEAQIILETVTDTQDDKKEDPLGDCPQTEEVITNWTNDNVYEQTVQNDDGLDTPLAAMLPSKYANVDVTELFPDFRPDKVSGLSRFLPQIWRGVKKRRRRKRSGSTSSDTPPLSSENQEAYGGKPTRVIRQLVTERGRQVSTSGACALALWTGSSVV
ncbi:Transcription initiation factor TFIID subunit 1 [Operophtera brumata]|uniref:Transcription initiation factor TFIID subunit 1 n=1 Tax=Operophtera brumata TaxID=104452 RepID=A0A0L7KW88_OPEBR|nr:Transcription initiation factor TFIID subunit 1 [Operophtera brumata]